MVKHLVGGLKKPFQIYVKMEDINGQLKYEYFVSVKYIQFLSLTHCYVKHTKKITKIKITVHTKKYMSNMQQPQSKMEYFL